MNQNTTSAHFKNLDDKLLLSDREELDDLKRSISFFYNKTAIVEFLTKLIQSDKCVDFSSERVIRQTRSSNPIFILQFDSKAYFEEIGREVPAHLAHETKIDYFITNIIAELTDELSREIALNDPEQSTTKLLRTKFAPTEVETVELLKSFASAVFAIDTTESWEGETVARLLFF